jgi:periplasmic protein CpxP/Spy
MLLRKVSLIAGICVLSLSANPAFSVPILDDNSPTLEMAQMMNHGGRGEGWKKGDFLEKLNLTDSQKQQISSIKKDHENELKPIKDQMRIKENELRTLMAGNASNDQLRSKHQELQQLRQKMGNLHFENMLEIRSVLTPEQRSQFNSMMGNMGDRSQRR